MVTERRIAILAGEVEGRRQSEFITGFVKKAVTENMDVCVFSMIQMYQDTQIRETGEANIFNLFNPVDYDGVVILKDSIQTSGVCRDLENRLVEAYNGPVLVIDRESDSFPSVFQDDYHGMSALVTHMIEEHGYRDIAYISGKRWHPHAVKRLQAYCDTMKRFGLKVGENRIFHGDFWYTCGEQALRQFTGRDNSLPEAVVCANDEMAIGFCEALEQRGLSVPEDIAVAGFDSSVEGRTGPRTLTSTMFPDEEGGIYAARYMKSKLDNLQEPEFTDKPRLLIGETCGCKRRNDSEVYIRRKAWKTDRMSNGLRTAGNLMSDNLMAQTSLQGFLGTVYSYIYQVNDVDRFSLCLCKPWMDIDKDPSLHVSNSGYPDEMINAISYNSTGKEGKVCCDETFKTSELLPELKKEHKNPLAYFFNPLFFEKECFGYAAVSYGDKARTYDGDYRFWLSMIARGLEDLRRNLIIESLKKQLENSMLNKFSTGSAKYELLSEEEKEECRLVDKILDENLLTYYFQPIVRASNGEIYSYEALMRSNTDKKISPLDIIKYAGIRGRLNDVEKATFINVLGIIEDKAESFVDAKIFLNSIPGIRLNDSDFDAVHELLKRNASKAVVELTEEAELSDEELDAVKRLLSELGIEMAIDDYGTGYSNISNLLRYMPNYVKIDRALLSGIESKPQKQHFVSEIIKFCRDNDILSLAEGIETGEELRTVIHMGVDLIQGYYTAKPSAEILPRINEMVRNEICTYYQERQDGSDKRIFTAGSSNRVSLGMLDRDGYTDINIGDKNAVYTDVAIIGSPGLKTDIHITILPGYTGEVRLENVELSNIKCRPCIDISENCDVTFKLSGENYLKGNGIRVTESSKLMLLGDGNLSIETKCARFYGIGNHPEESHGELLFEQDGRISVKASGQEGTCIGSGKGGVIRINRGQYNLFAGAGFTTGIGALAGDSRFEIRNSWMGLELNGDNAVAIGSLKGDAGLYVLKTAIEVTMSGDRAVVIGTLDGSESITLIEDSRVNLNLRADDSTCVGALNGRTDLTVNHTSIQLENSGDEALIFGGRECITNITLDKVDVKSDLRSKLNRDTYASEDDIYIHDGRSRFNVNGKEVKRKVIWLD